ncbi:hypothetical protein ACOSQ2_017208 [Xanthoceras sorbifolium]
MLCMTKSIGRFLGNQIGEVREIDAGASGDCLGKYIRVRVVLDISKPLQRFLKVNMGNPGKDVIMLLRYKRLLQYCFGYGFIGHSMRECEHGSGVGDTRLKDSSFGLWMRASSPVKSRRAPDRSGRIGSGGATVVEQNIKAVAMHGSVTEEGLLHGSDSENGMLHGSVSEKEALCRTLLHVSNLKTVYEDCLRWLFHEVHSLAVASSTDSGLPGEKASSHGRRWKRRARDRIEVDVGMAHKELGTKWLNPLDDADDAQLVKKSRSGVAFAWDSSLLAV